MTPEARKAELEATCRDWHQNYGTFCPECRAVCEAAFAIAPVRHAEDARVAVQSFTTALEALTDHYLARTEQAEQDARDAVAQARARELDLLLVALRHDAPVPPLASKGLDTIRQLWARSAAYVPVMSRRERWALLVEVYPPAGVLSRRGTDAVPVGSRVAA